MRYFWDAMHCMNVEKPGSLLASACFAQAMKLATRMTSGHDPMLIHEYLVSFLFPPLQGQGDTASDLR